MYSWNSTVLPVALVQLLTFKTTSNVSTLIINMSVICKLNTVKYLPYLVSMIISSFEYRNEKENTLKSCVYFKRSL